MRNCPAMTLFAYNTKRLLAACGWAQKDLADSLGTHPQNLSRSLKGTHSPSLEFVQGVADVLHVDVRELFKPIPKDAASALAK